MAFSFVASVMLCSMFLFAQGVQAAPQRSTVITGRLRATDESELGHASQYKRVYNY